MNEFDARMQTYREAVETYLDECFTEDLPQKRLFEAMRYSLLAGGKRIRPVLVLEFCRVCGGDWKQAVPIAAAVEMVHTYSLIHDDLPCMDNDDYRRGKLTNHKVFGESTAVLAGDALLTAAFETLANSGADADVIAGTVQTLAGAAGELGMVGGQVLDLAAEEETPDAEHIYTLQDLKTGALIRAACCCGVVAGHGSAAQYNAAAQYATALGLAFQIRDDMLDVLGDAKTLGKAVHVDEKKGTFVRLYGLERCGEMIAAEGEKAEVALEVFEDPAFLKELVQKLAVRES